MFEQIRACSSLVCPHTSETWSHLRGSDDISRAEMEFGISRACPPDAPDRDSVRKHLMEMRGGAPSK